MTSVQCPRCGTKVEWEQSLFRPFCSEICKAKDLGDWAMEKYRLPVEEESPGEVSPDSASEQKKTKH